MEKSSIAARWRAFWHGAIALGLSDIADGTLSASVVQTTTRRSSHVCSLPFPLSQHARRVIALLEEAELPYELRPVDMAAGEHMSAEFRKINPNHQYPVLVDGDLQLSESNAILRYLCAKHDLTDWYPPTSARGPLWSNGLTGTSLASVRRSWTLSGTECFWVPPVTPRPSSAESSDWPMRRRFWNSAFLLRPYVAGEAPTIADLSIASNLTQLQLANAMPATQAIAAWHQRISSLPGVQKACAPMQAMMKS